MHLVEIPLKKPTRVCEINYEKFINKMSLFCTQTHTHESSFLHIKLNNKYYG